MTQAELRAMGRAYAKARAEERKEDEREAANSRAAYATERQRIETNARLKTEAENQRWAARRASTALSKRNYASAYTELRRAGYSAAEAFALVDIQRRADADFDEEMRHQELLEGQQRLLEGQWQLRNDLYYR